MSAEISPKIESEYWTAKKSRVLLDLSSFGKILVSGNDRVEVLHNILTQDIKSLRTGQSAPAALLSSQGKMLAWFGVFIFTDHIILITEPGFEEKAIPLLDKFIISEDVSLKKATEDYALFQLIYPSPPKDELFLIPKNAGQLMKEKIFQEDGSPVPEISWETWEILRIERGFPRYGIDMDENTILSETGLDSTAASSTKGCYPGQEVVARIETYKGLNRKLKRLILRGSQKPNFSDKIFTEDGQTEIGRLTSSAYSPKQKGWAALGYLNKAYFEGARKIKIFSAGNWFEGETLA